MKNFLYLVRQEVKFNILMFFVFLFGCSLLLLLEVLMSFGISWYLNDFKINMIFSSLIYGLKDVFVENDAKNLLYYWHIILFFSIMGVIHLPIFMKYTEDESGNKIFLPSEKRTWKQWIVRFFVLLISNSIVVVLAGIIMLSIDYLISLA